MFRFGRVAVDLAQREVRVDGDLRHLEPQAFDLLHYLLENRDRVLSKEELLDQVWGDHFVSESALTTRIKEIRRAVDDDGERQAVIKNFRGRGYRCVADVTAADPPPPSGTPENGASLVGRSADVAEVEARLDAVGVVTLAGPGGAGKTTLAHAVAQRAKHRHSDGIHTVRLARVTEEADVVHAFRLDLGVDAKATGEDDLFSTIAALDALVVVDNCEHVIAEAARVVDQISQRGGPIRILATSRERLGVAREQVWPVGPLDPSAARVLLAARVDAAHPDYPLDEEDDADVDRLLTMVDRLPLGIEMAAPRLPAFGATQLIAHLTDRLELLRAPHRASEDRHQTLFALVDWSLRLLEPATRHVLTDLSVFAGPVLLDDVAAVLDRRGPDLALGPLADLVEQSLVVAEGAGSAEGTRYRLLETVRAAAAPERLPEVDERHATHMASVAAEADRLIRSPAEARGATRLDGLLDELRLVHRWARANDIDLAASLSLSLHQYAYERHWPEPAEWVEPLSGNDPAHQSREEFAAVVAADATVRGDYDRARSLAERARSSDNPHVVGIALDALSNVGIYTGDLESSMRVGDELTRLGRQLADPYMWTLGKIGRGLALIYDGRAAEAQEGLDYRDPPAPLSPTCSAWLAYTEAEIATAEGRTNDALEVFERAIEAARSVGNRFVVNVSEVSRLTAIARGGDLDTAAATFAPVLERYRRRHSTTHMATALHNVVWLLVRTRHDEPAMRILGALDAASTKAAYGTESDLLDEARSTAEARNGTDVVAGWLKDGSGQGYTWAVDQAIEVLATHS